MSAWYSSVVSLRHRPRDSKRTTTQYMQVSTSRVNEGKLFDHSAVTLPIERLQWLLFFLLFAMKSLTKQAQCSEYLAPMSKMEANTTTLPAAVPNSSAVSRFGRI